MGAKIFAVIVIAVVLILAFNRGAHLDDDDEDDGP